MNNSLTVANKGCDGFSLGPGGSLEETVSQLIPAEQAQEAKVRMTSQL